MVSTPTGGPLAGPVIVGGSSSGGSGYNSQESKVPSISAGSAGAATGSNSPTPTPQPPVPVINSTKYNYVKGSTVDFSPPRVNIGGVVPYVIGTELVRSPTIIWYGNVRPLKERVTTTDTAPSGSEIGGSVTTYTVTTNIVGYLLDIQLAICTGPEVKLRSVYFGRDKVWNGTIGPERTELTIDGHPSVFYGGQWDQEAEPHIQQFETNEVPGYVGISYILIRDIRSDELPNIAVEVERFSDVLGLGGANRIGDDINPISAIADVITIIRGGLGKPLSVIDEVNFNAIAAVLEGEENYSSMIISDVASGTNIFKILLSQINGIMTVNPNLNKVQVYLDRDTDSPVLTIEDEDIISNNSFSKPSWESVATTIILNYTNRDNKYITDTVTAKNLLPTAEVANRTSNLNYLSVMNVDLATKLISRDMARVGSPVQDMTLTLTRKAARLLPGQKILINSDKYNYYDIMLLVLKRRTQNTLSNNVTLNGMYVLYPKNNVIVEYPPPSKGFAELIGPKPLPPVDAVIMSAPFFIYNDSLTATKNEVWANTYSDWRNPVLRDITNARPLIFATAADQYQLGYRVYRETGETDPEFASVRSHIYSLSSLSGDLGIDVVMNYSPIWKLSVTVDKYDGWDTGITDIVIDFSDDYADLQQNLDAFTYLYASIGNNSLHGYLIIDEEWFAFGSDSEVETNYDTKKCTISNCRRAMVDTVAADHYDGANIYLIQQISGGIGGDTWLKNAFDYKQQMDIYFDYRDSGDPAPTGYWFLTGTAWVKGKKQESPLDHENPYTIAWEADDRAARPLRPHNTKINDLRQEAPIALSLGGSADITWNIRSRYNFTTRGTSPTYKWLVYTLPAEQLDDNDPIIEQNLNGDGLTFRVMISDSNNDEYDCGLTGNNEDNITITVPGAAAAGDGFLWVQAEFTMDNGRTTISYQHDKVPITLS